jgi:hypothetical protein
MIVIPFYAPDGFAAREIVKPIAAKTLEPERA